MFKVLFRAMIFVTAATKLYQTGVNEKLKYEYKKAKMEAKIKKLSENTLKRAYGLSKESSKIFGMNPSEIQTKNDIDRCITKLSKLSKEMEDNGKTSITEFFQNKKKNVGKDGISVW